MEPNNEDFDSKRFITALVLSGLVLVVWQYFFAPPPPPPPETGDAAIVKSEDGSEAPTPTGDAEKTEKVPQAEPIAAPTPPKKLPIETHTLGSDAVRLKTSSRGARVVATNVLSPDQYQAAGDLLESFPEDSTHFPFGIGFSKNSIALHRDLVWAVVPEKSKQSGEAYEQITYRHTDAAGRFSIEKTFSVKPDERYQFELAVAVTNHEADSRITDRLALDVFGYKDPNKEGSFLDPRPDEPEAICRTTEDIERELFSAADKPLVFDEHPTLFGAMDSRYFLFAAVPDDKATKCSMEVQEESYLRTRIVQPEFSIGPGETYRSNYRLFIGPKDIESLEAVGANLEESVDYGVLTFLARPMRWMLVQFYNLVGNWGLAIILLTLVIRLLMWPVNHKVYVNGERMKDLQPLMQEINEKYKDDPQRRGEETMKAWKEHNVSPLGCLPMVLQMPILLALYFMILYSVELYQANFAFWYTDLSAADPYYVLPIAMGIVMFVQQQWMTPQQTQGGEAMQQQMQQMMKIMPVMFTAFMLFLPSGVVLYYFVSLLLGLVQQFWIKRSFRLKREAAAAAAS